MRGHPEPDDRHAVDRLRQRRQRLTAVLGARGDVLAVLGLGSTGADSRRLDRHSDLDVFVVVQDEDAAARYRSDAGWWSDVAGVAFAFAHTHDGWKVLFDDGVFVECAVLTVEELRGVPYAGAAVLWRRSDAPADLAVAGRAPTSPHTPSDAHQVGEALTNLWVGLHRLQRGEVLSATRLIQVHAVDRILTLLERSDPAGRRRQDPFAIERGAEEQHAGRDLPLADLVPGYRHNVEASAAVLAWLRRNVPEAVDSTMAAAVEGLVESCG